MNNKTDLSTIFKPIRQQLAEVGKYIKQQLNTDIPILDESSSHLFINGGKQIRAALVICSSGIKEDVPAGIIQIASASEIVHAATLIHDDIIDQSELRRGLASVPSKWGSKVSVLVGDYMYTLALNIIVANNSIDLFKVMVYGTREMVKGELYQLQYSDIDKINRDHYFRIIELKTAIFMGCCTKLGAIKAGCTLEEQGKLYNAGYNLGFAFQLIDDTLDYVDDVITGKESGNDYFTGKITLPYIYLLENAGKVEYQELIKYAKQPNRKNWNIVKELMVEKDILSHVQKLSCEYIDKSIEFLKGFSENKYYKVLIALCDFLRFRKY